MACARLSQCFGVCHSRGASSGAGKHALVSSRPSAMLSSMFCQPPCCGDPEASEGTQPSQLLAVQLWPSGGRGAVVLPARDARGSAAHMLGVAREPRTFGSDDRRISVTMRPVLTQQQPQQTGADAALRRCRRGRERITAASSRNQRTHCPVLLATTHDAIV